VAARHLRAGALHARHARAVGALHLAVGRTAVALGDVAVVAHLAARDLDDAVATAGCGHAGHAGRRADGAGLDLAARAAAVVRRRVAVVAVLARLDALVSADGRPDAHAARDAGERGILHGAGRVASVAVGLVLVVADLARVDDAVSAGAVAHAGALGRARPVRLDVAGAVAAVAGDRVAVVALLDAALVVDPVAATRRCGQRSAGSGRAGSAGRSGAADDAHAAARARGAGSAGRSGAALLVRLLDARGAAVDTNTQQREAQRDTERRTKNVFQHKRSLPARVHRGSNPLDAKLLPPAA